MTWAPYPGARTPTTLFVEAFGYLVRPTQQSLRVADEEDLYSVFSARAHLMGWSSTLRGGSPPDAAEPSSLSGLWGMNDAELTAGHGTPRIGWAQVGLEAGVDATAALPPLLQCLDDALRRFGNVELTALQVTASEAQPGTESAAWDLVAANNWFNVLHAKAEAVIALDDTLFHRRSESEFIASLQRLNTGFFEFGSPVEVSQELQVEVAPEWLRARLSPAKRGISVALPEWSVSAAAWALAITVATARADNAASPRFAARITRR